MTDEKITLRSLERDVEREVREWMAEAPDERPDSSDIAHQIAESNTPHMNQTCIQIVADEMQLWNYESELYHPNYCTPADLCQSVIYEWLREFAYEIIERVKEEIQAEIEDAAIAAHEARMEAKADDTWDRGI